MSNKKAKYKSHFPEAWLSESEYSRWLKKGQNGDTLALVAHAKKALVLHASCEFCKSRLPTSSQTTVKFVKDKPEEKENIPENENTAST